jgi:hypothetical protein
MRGGLQQGRLEYQVTLRVFFKVMDAEGGEGKTSEDSSFV